MKQKKIKLSTILFLVLGLTRLQAQESINAAGSDASSEGGSASYTLGQVVYQTHSGTSGSASEIIQQSYVVSVLMATEETQDIHLSVSAYPNPTTDFFQLKINTSVLQSTSPLSYQLFDMQGKLLQTKELTDTETQIDLTNHHPSVYIMKVMKNGQSVKEFKIIKK